MTDISTGAEAVESMAIQIQCSDSEGQGEWWANNAADLLRALAVERDALRARLAECGKALEHASDHIRGMHKSILDRSYKADELLHPDAWLGVCDGSYNGDWASIREIIDAAMEKANG